MAKSRCFSSLAALFFGLAAYAAGPLMELYPSHVSFLLDYDAGSYLPTIGETKTPSVQSACTFGATSGLFGTTGLDEGSVNYDLLDDHTVIDMTKSGTVVFWLKQISAPDTSSGNEPSGNNFTAQYDSRKRWFVFRQSLPWGQGRLATRFETLDANGQFYVVQDYYPASLKTWKPGEWHLCATTHTPTGFGISVDGQPFKNIVSSEPLGPISKYINFRAFGNCTLDDCAILDFKMSDDQVKEFYDEYMAQLQESPRIAGDPSFGALRTVADSPSAYLISLAVTNDTAQSITVRWKATATPDSSQPATANTLVTIPAGASQVLQLGGPALDEETVVADVTVESSDGSRILFRRHRVFAPHSGEPEWMGEQASFGLSFAYYPTTNTIHALVDMTGNDDYSSASAIRCSILEENGRSVAATADFSPDASGRTEIFWRNLPELEGSYIFRAEAVGIGNASAEQPFVRVRPEWEGNRLGLSGTVPAPFTPVEYEGNHVRTVLRDHEIGAFGLWNQVTAEGRNILARPMALKSGGSTVTSSSLMSATSEWDVDGMMVWKLTLLPGRHNALSLEIPLLSSRATLMHACSDGLRSNYAGAVPAGDGSVWNSSQAVRTYIVGDYLPYIWVGGPLRGISVFGENDKGWITADGVHHQEIVRENDGTVTLRLNLVAAATDITEARTIKIGFMATPVKPMLEDWRSVDHGRLLGGNMYYGGAYASLADFNNSDSFLQVMGEERRTGVFNSAFLETAVNSFPYGSPLDTPEGQAQRDSIYAHYRSGLVTAYTEGHNPDTRLVFYTNARGAYYGDAWGQGATFCNEWCRQEYMGREFRIDSCAYTDNDPTASFRDYAAWWYERMLSTGAGDFIYWDNVFCQSSFNQVQTDAYRLPTGAIQPSSGIFNMRELVKRAAVLQAELGKNTRGNWVHMTNTALAPVLAFAGVNYDWEDLADTRTFQQRYSREYILASAIGRQFGNRVSIIGYFDKSNASTFNWLVHTGVGVMLTHELRWIDTDHDEYRRAHAALCNWGYRTSDVDVWNYWDEDVAYPLEVSGVECASIALAKPAASEAYICVSSFSDADGSVTIRPDLAAMGIGASEWTATLMSLSGNSLVPAGELPVTDGAFSVTLPRYDWALVKISTSGEQEEEPEDLTGCDELLEFVETDGAQWIDTGIRPNPRTTSVKARFIPLEASTDNIALFGVNGTSGNTTDTKNFNAVLSNAGGGYKIRNLWAGASASPAYYPQNGSYVVGKPYEIAFDHSGSAPKATVNGWFASNGSTAKFDGQLSGSLYIGNINDAGGGIYTSNASGWRMGKVRWLGFRVYDEGVLVADLRPATRSGHIGFHDSVTDKFFKSQGARPFIAPIYENWANGAVPSRGTVAVIGSGETRRVSYADVAAMNDLAGIRMLDDDTQLVFTNGNVSSVTLYTPIFGRGKVVNQNSNSSTSCLLNFSGDSSGFAGEFVISNAYTAAYFAPYAFGTTNKVTVNNADSSDKRRFLLNETVCGNEFHIVRCANHFIGYGNPTVTGPVYLEGATELSIHGNGSGIVFTGPFHCTMPNDTSKLNLNANVTLSGGADAVKYFGRKQVRGPNQVILGSPMRFEEKTYSSTLMNNCNYSCNSGGTTTFAMTNVFDESAFFVCNYDAANTATTETTMDLNGFDQQVGTFGVSSKSGFDTSANYNPNLTITSAQPAVFSIRKTCRNDNAANCFHGSIRGKVSLCMDSLDDTPGKIRLNCPGSTTSGSLIARRGTIEVMPTATMANLASLVVDGGKISVAAASVGNSNADFFIDISGDGVSTGLEIAAGVTLLANTARVNGRWLQPGLYGKNWDHCQGIMGDGQLRVVAYGGTGPEVVEPPDENAPAIEDQGDGLYIIIASDTSASTVGLSGLGADDRVIIPAQIDTLKGTASASQIAGVVTSKGVDITAGCRITVADNIATIALDGAKSVAVTIGGKTENISIAPELAATDAAGDDAAPFVVKDGSVSLNIATIPGLKYQLEKTASLDRKSALWVPVGEAVMAETTRLKLTDYNPLQSSSFYKVIVFK